MLLFFKSGHWYTNVPSKPGKSLSNHHFYLDDGTCCFTYPFSFIGKPICHSYAWASGWYTRNLIWFSKWTMGWLCNMVCMLVLYVEFRGEMLKYIIAQVGIQTNGNYLSLTFNRLSIHSLVCFCCGLNMFHASVSFQLLSLYGPVVSCQSSLLNHPHMFAVVSLFLVCYAVFLILFPAGYHNDHLSFHRLDRLDNVYRNMRYRRNTSQTKV